MSRLENLIAGSIPLTLGAASLVMTVVPAAATDVAFRMTYNNWNNNFPQAMTGVYAGILTTSLVGLNLAISYWSFREAFRLFTKK